MNRLKWLIVTNIVLFCSMAVQVITGIMLFFGMFLRHLGFTERLHSYNGLALVILVVLHIALNWGWVKANIFRLRHRVIS